MLHITLTGIRKPKTFGQTSPKTLISKTHEKNARSLKRSLYLLFSGGDVDENLATNANKDGSREDKTDYDRVVLTAGESSRGLCTYLNLAPTVEPKEQKQNALDELI